MEFVPYPGKFPMIEKFVEAFSAPWRMAQAEGREAPTP
jgi:hypothetical protein